ncbi:hypothetical protein [Bacillus weihaiensis]|uniref:hypothetical protein n=1 Tax=Bacillus weihaiensis TaxID=1547283 RepID=UPI002354338A|nr:hypothetical protein [Bacillus weihaiensis]
MSERQRAFTIKTNKISQAVYDKLEEKAKGRQLGDYIESLVMRDILGDSTHNDNSTHEMLHTINKQLIELKELASSSPLNLSASSIETKTDDITSFEGQLVDLEEVQGHLDDDDLEEYSDF